MQTVVSVKNLKKTFKTYKRGEKFSDAVKSLFKREFITHEALKGISFEIKEGEVVGLIGPNGAGKSTCIKALCGILYPTAGELNVLGYKPWHEREAYVKNIGVIFGQKHPLWWDNPPIDTFYLMKELYDIPKTVFERRLNFLIKEFRLKAVYKTPVRNLSLGERMKASIVVALLHNPKLVFFDEPTIGMDIISKDVFRKLVKDINKKYNTTFIITTHDMNDIEKLCKRVIIINHGEIIYDGLLEEIKKKYIQKKIVEVTFDERTEVKVPKGCKTLFKSVYKIRINVPLKKHKIDKIINYFLDKYPVVDITISDPEIEEIIREIYSS